MASFPDVRPSSERSANAECFVVLRCPLAAIRSALTLSELATLRGRCAVHSFDVQVSA
jgi:hypothetical protein